MHNVNSMMYVGERPWHGLGKRLEREATAAEAITAAGLDWGVEKVPVFTQEGKGVPGRFATVRTDNRAPLGIVGKRYRPLQNKEAFSFFDAVVGEKSAIYHTAGALGDGERVWILAKIPGEIRVVGDDITERFLLLTNRHDGMGSVEVMLTPIRVVCQNTLNGAVGAAKTRAGLRHTESLGTRIDEVREKLGIAVQRFADFEEAAKALASRQINSEELRSFAVQTITGKAIPDGRSANQAYSELAGRSRNQVDNIERLFTEGMGQDLPGVRGTAWAAYNSAVELVDYAKADKPEKDGERTRSLLYGYGAERKAKAWSLAMDLVKS